MNAVIESCARFFKRCKVAGTYAYRPYLDSPNETLYASAFAVMTLHYTGDLQKMDDEELSKWGKYLNSFQSAETGLYDSHELHDGLGVHHNLEHRRLHLTCHVLPALNLLGAKPKYRISYVDRYLDAELFNQWLSARDMNMAWVEGNNLLFAGQLLINEIEESGNGTESLDLLFAWLEKNVDKKTALWGTDHGCSLHKAMYGAYHQLILYYYTGRDVLHIEQLIDSVLACQHFDGGYSEWRGGGTCQDIDAIDILVNCYMISPYKRREIRRSLRFALRHVLRDRYVASEGGFQDRKGHGFIHNSMPATKTPINRANTFSTWFTVHALCDIGRVLQEDSFFKGTKLANFNKTCSMGWGGVDVLVGYDSIEERFDSFVFSIKSLVTNCYDFCKSIKAE